MNDQESQMTPEDLSVAIEEKIKRICQENLYPGVVFHAGCVYFVITNDKIYEIPDDASSGPKGGWFPEIFKGLTCEDSAAIDDILDKINVDESFWERIEEDCSDDPDEDELLEYFEDEEDNQDIVRKLSELVSKKDEFLSLQDFFIKRKRVGLNPDALYYMWEGEPVDFYENISWCGEGRGEYYEGLDDEEWLDVLDNLDEHIVGPDE